MLTRILAVYSTVLTTVVAAFTFAGSAAARIQHYDEIDVHRLNVREPDGTLRMVISNHARLPGVIVRGKENPRVDRPYAGMLFYNDEGTENGGLVFGGHRNANGEVVDAGVALSFDRYGASSQFVQLAGVQDSKNHIVGLTLSETEPTGNRRRLFIGHDHDQTLAPLVRLPDVDHLVFNTMNIIESTLRDTALNGHLSALMSHFSFITGTALSTLGTFCRCTTVT